MMNRIAAAMLFPLALFAAVIGIVLLLVDDIIAHITGDS